MKKKILSFMLAFAFVLFVLPAGSTAVEEKSAVNGKDKKEAMEVVKNFISKAFSLQVENFRDILSISRAPAADRARPCLRRSRRNARLAFGEKIGRAHV